MGFFGGGSSKKPGEQTGSHRAVLAYGIEDAIKLMRTLPAEGNAELVVRVVKHTLESVNVHLTDIINDAAAKQKALGERRTALLQQISELEGEIAKRREEIYRIEADLDETTNVKERLALVEAHAAEEAALRPDESTPVPLVRPSTVKAG